MKTKNKKILTRLSAVLATCLLLVALAVPCFADETEQTQYVLTEVTFSTYDEMYSYVSDNFAMISHIVMEDTNTVIFRPTLFRDGGTDVAYVFISPAIISGSEYSIEFSASATLTVDGIYLTILQGVVNTDLNVQTQFLPSSGYGGEGFAVFVYEPAELIPAPIDPDAPTRTGLYGELYHIIRDAIYGENALLDSTQEFTLTQISTWMTYIVILLPLVVIGIILFKIFVR